MEIRQLLRPERLRLRRDVGRYDHPDQGLELDGQPLDKQNILLQLNIADDYFKAKKQISILEEELQGKEKELYDLKHELISAQIKLENAEKQGKELQKQLNEDAKKIVRLETELKDK